MDFSGLPTIAMPCGFNKDGLPLSCQLVGHKLSEQLLIQAGATYQRATDWHTTAHQAGHSFLDFD